jgi:GntR family transcriptional regulator
MFFHIDPADGLAIYDQVVRQVKFAIAGGVLQPGNLVPSVRELARELAINPNTVARAYQKLQADGVLQSVRGMGLEVAADAVVQCRAERQKLIRARIAQALVEAVVVDAVAMWATRRRIARLQLALAAWRAEHGHLPQRLDQLVDAELDSLPIDPFTGHSFRYQMEGADSDFACRNISTSARKTSERSIAAGTPFLWSAGPDVVYSPYTRSGPVTAKLPEEFTHVDYVFCPPSGGTPQPITTDRELWTRGVCFPIPRVAVD